MFSSKRSRKYPPPADASNDNTPVCIDISERCVIIFEYSLKSYYCDIFSNKAYYFDCYLKFQANIHLLFVYNAFKGTKCQEISLVHSNVLINSDRNYCFELWHLQWVLSIINTKFTGFRTILVDIRDGGNYRCLCYCNHLSNMRGSQHLGTNFLKKWGYKLSKCLECHTKVEFFSLITRTR